MRFRRSCVVVALTVSATSLPATAQAARPPALFAAPAATLSYEIPRHQRQCTDSVVALVGGTLIDGTGARPQPDVTILVCGSRIRAIGRRGSVAIPPAASVIDVAGKYLVPGFIDTNVHFVQELPVALLDRPDSLVGLGLLAAQRHLERGVTSVRDTYGVLALALQVRNQIDRQEAIGPRVLVAGNVVGWGGRGSRTYDEGGGRLAPAQLEVQRRTTEGVGEELIDLEVDSLRVRIDRYLDKGVDFIKYGGTTHGSSPTLILFSQAAQTAIVEQAHRRGKKVSTHCIAPEALRMCVLAGVDIVQHANIETAPLSPALAKLLVDHHVVCSVNPTVIRSRMLRGMREHPDSVAIVRHLWPEIDQFYARLSGEVTVNPAGRINPNRNADGTEDGYQLASYAEPNLRTLIAAGCTLSVETDDQMGVRTLEAIESLVEVGLTPLQAIVAATRNGAVATGGLADYGTLEEGKHADLVVLTADPLTNIANIEQQQLVMRDGRIVVQNGRVVGRTTASRSAGALRYAE